MSDEKLYQLHGKVEALISTTEALKDVVEKHIIHSDKTNDELAKSVSDISSQVNSLKITVASVASGITLIVTFASEWLKSKLFS